MPSTISAGTTAGTAIAIAGDTTGNLAFQTNGTTTAMTITTSQNVGVGITNPTHKIAIGYSNADSSNKIAVGNIADYQGLLDFNNGNEVFTVENTTDYSIGGIAFKVNGANRGFFDINGNFQFNSGYGSVAVAYGCRAWVNFNGTGTVAIRASGNVSSITDVNTGDYRVNFTNSMPDTNYATTAGGWDGALPRTIFSRPNAASNVIVQFYNGSSLYDEGFAQIVVHR